MYKIVARFILFCVRIDVFSVNFLSLSIIFWQNVVAMNQKIVYPTSGVCSQAIVIELDGEVITSVEFIGGCQGNTKGVAALAVGMPVKEVIQRLQGIDCGRKGTSCPDQLARALRKITNQE